MFIAQSWIESLIGRGTPGWTISPEELDAGFVRVGFETEGYSALPPVKGPLVIGQVLEIEELTGFKKPIRYCQVDVGQANGTGEPQGIICGARNFAQGDYVVVSLPGAELPGGFKISARKTYDHISNGMMCSAAELGLTEKQTKGIITLPAGYGVPGEPAAPLIGLEDTQFEVNITPDRGYALSARGLTREISSAFNLPFQDPAENPAVAGIDVSQVPEPTGEGLKVSVDADTKATRFGIRTVTGVDPLVESPYWMQRELMLCGQRPVNAATDITNYVMFLLGQPMHAYDADKVSGQLHIRRAQAGETLETLDHLTRDLDPEDVVVADDNHALGLAGVMGGVDSEISGTTTSLIFEAATWDPVVVARTARRHKLSSEASRRFERQVDPALVETALDIACALMVAIGGGQIESARTVWGEVPTATPITLDPAFPSQLVGVEYSLETVVERLTEVGCTVSHAGGTSSDASDADSSVGTGAQKPQLLVTPPTWRGDLSMPADLVEEILRLEGLDSVPRHLPTPPPGRGLTPRQRRHRAVGHALAYSGYVEIFPTPFIRQDTFDVWELPAEDPRRSTVTVQNPLESDHCVLATTLLPAMLEAVSRNIARGTTSLSIFGVQQVAFKKAKRSPMLSTAGRPSAEELKKLLESLPDQPLHAAVVGVGKVVKEGPLGHAVDYTWADAVEAAQIVARAAGVQLTVRAGDSKPWHPGRCADLYVGDTLVGHAGELHPEILERVGLPERVCAMEMSIDALPLSEHLPAPTLSAFPALHQDLAVVVDESVPAARVQAVLTEGAGDLLESLELFDIYRSDQLGENKKSLAFEMLFRASDRTLTDEEANQAREAAVQLAAEKLGATMRA